MSEIELSKQTASPENLLEMGKLYSERGDLLMAMPKLTEAAQIFFRKKDYRGYLECQNALLRIYVEREQFEDILKTKEILQDLVLKEGFELNARTYYILAICESYKSQFDGALEYFQKSLALALATDNKRDICYAIHGIAICYKDLGKYADALKEIYNLQVFFQVLDVPEVKISSQILNAVILNELKKHDQALELLWQTLDLLKTNKYLTAQINVFYRMGQTYVLMGEKDLARTHFKLCARSIDSQNLVRMSRAVNAALADLGGDGATNYDLIFELENHAIVEKKLGRVDFKNQFILMDLLKLFVKNQGQVYSKEFLVENVWRQAYDPSVHDNKIYVTIKRLRKMIEPDYEKPKYIFRAKNGYFMNKSAKVLIEQKGELQ